MKVILLLVLSALVSAAEPEPARSKPAEAPSTTLPAGTEDPAAKAYEQLLEKDEAALDAIDKMIKEAEAFERQGAPTPRSILMERIEGQVAPIKKSYEDFLLKYPKHIEGRLAYGSFLNEIGETEDAITQWEKARELAPDNPAAWNNLANIYGHIGPVRKALNYYEKAIELNPKEPVYIQNLATTVYLFRKDAAEVYRLNEEQVFNKALDLYKQAIKLDPTNFTLATDLAQSYYGIKPLRTEEALSAWNYALEQAKGDLEKQGVYLHMARVELNSGLFQEAQQHLELVKHPELQDLRTRLQKNLVRKKEEAAGVNQETKAVEKTTPPADTGAVIAEPRKEVTRSDK